MTRDTQKQKVYNAEWRAHYGTEEAIKVSDSQFILDLLADEFEVSAPTIKVNRRIKAYGGWYKGWQRLIEVPSTVTSLKTLLHEFSHHLEKERRNATDPKERYFDPGHGGAFVESHLDVVEAYYGTQARSELADAYVRANVVTSAKAALDKRQKAREAAEKRKQRDGEKATVYVVANGLETDGTNGMWVKDASHWAYHVVDAKPYKTLRGAKNAADGFMRATIYALPGTYRVDFDGAGRWVKDWHAEGVVVTQFTPDQNDGHGGWAVPSVEAQQQGWHPRGRRAA